MEVDSLALEAAKDVEVEAVMEEDPGEEVEAVVEEEVGAAVEKEVEGHPSPSPIPQNLVAVTHKVRDNSKVVGWGRHRCQLSRHHPF